MGFFSKILDKLGFDAGVSKVEEMLRALVVDLLKLLDIDSSLTARKEVATELGCPAT